VVGWVGEGGRVEFGDELGFYGGSLEDVVEYGFEDDACCICTG
jgi:hypothetical protein